MEQIVIDRFFDRKTKEYSWQLKVGAEVVASEELFDQIKVDDFAWYMADVLIARTIKQLQDALANEGKLVVMTPIREVN